MWCVVADNGDEFWVYGIFLDKKHATEFADKLQIENPDIDYTVAAFLAANSEQTAYNDI